jgi:hypothetical protein
VPIITISRGSYSRGKEVAEKLSQALGYQCISRDILLEASEHYNIPEIKLIRAIHDAPSILGRFSYMKKKPSCPTSGRPSCARSRRTT